MQKLDWKVGPDLIICNGYIQPSILSHDAYDFALINLVDGIEIKDKIHPIISEQKILVLDINLNQYITSLATKQ